MLSLFLNPFTMFAGAGLVLAPIIIHLINRMRYRRVPWAAMEFLLKSVKKNRRKLVLKQLLLLLLRCAIVFLFGVLLARYIGSALGFGQPRSTHHVVILDNTASMTDAWRQDGLVKTTFDHAKKAIIDDIASAAAAAGTPQSLEIVLLASPAESHRIERLNPQSVAELQAWLGGVKPTAMHAPFLPAVEAAKSIFDRDPQARRVLHVISDFRSFDWSGSASATLSKSIPEAVIAKTGAVHLMDVADPARSANRSGALDHGNIGILDLQPETRIASRHMPVEFAFTVANFTPTSRKNLRVIVRINGQMREDASMTILEAPPGQTTSTFIASFDRVGANMVTASIEPDEAGLTVDDLRYASIQVREKVPLLFVTSADSTGRARQEADGFYLRALFLDAAKGYDVIERGPQELEQPNLERFPTIYLLNVARLSDKAKSNLESYVRSGGGLFVTCGDQVDADFYTRWYADGKGAFPMPIGKPTEPLNDAQRTERMFDPTLPPKVFPRSETHPVMSRIYRDDRNREVNTYLKFLFVDRYVPVSRSRWMPEPGHSEELFTLPNDRSIEDYKEPAQRLLNRLPTDDPKFAQFREKFRGHQRNVREVLAGNRPLYALADAIDTLLNDRVNANKPEAANLQEYWVQPDQAALRADILRFLESVRYGDPLLVSQSFGRGRVLALTTSAGSAWNDWPSGPARPYWVMLMLEAQKYLSSVAADDNRFVGATLEVAVDANRFEPRLRRVFVPEVTPEAPAGAGPVDQGEPIAQLSGSKLTYVFNDARIPGIYRFDIASKDQGESKTESLAFAFNVNTAAEGGLKRATRDELAAAAPGMQLHFPGSGLSRVLKERTSDLSESPWFYFALLLLLIAEQSLAVHLSFHVRTDTAQARTPTQRTS